MSMIKRQSAGARLACAGALLCGTDVFYVRRESSAEQ